MAKKILVIDDEHELVKAVEIRLRASGYEVEVAYDGASGIEKVKETRPDLVLLDIIMPKMNGHEVCEKLIADSETKGIPIIIFTASQKKGLEAKCKDSGVTDFIVKPFETENLLNIVNEILNKD